MKIGLALGGGAARGWAHIGVLRALEEEGIRPDIICGTSIGALVGAAYVSGNLDPFETWVRSLTWWDIVRLMDPAVAGGGFITGGSLMRTFREHLSTETIEELEQTFATVATNLRTGQEVWLQRGSLLDSVRASIALPGLLTPVQVDGQWLVDGGLVNPVPVSLCRHLGAELIIAVNLNGDIVGRHFPTHQAVSEKPEPRDGDLWDQFVNRLNTGIRDSSLGKLVARKEPPGPGLLDVIASAINIMEDRITRSRLAGDPADILISPRLGSLGLFEFDRAEEAIAEGRNAARDMLPAIRQSLSRE